MTNPNKPPRESLGMRMAGHLGSLAGLFVPARTKRRFQADYNHLRLTGEFPDQRDHPAFAERQLTRHEIAAVSLAMLNKTYHPIQAVDSYASFIAQNYPGANVQQYRQQYIQGKNMLLNQLLSPIVITERPTIPRQNAGEPVVCNGCHHPLPANRMRLIGAQRPEDLSLRMTDYQTEPSVVIAESPIGAIHEATLTDADIHQLVTHPESDDAMRVVTTLSGFQDFFSGDTVNVMEHPAFLPKLPGQR
jgi:hypothetical protein